MGVGEGVLVAGVGSCEQGCPVSGGPVVALYEGAVA